MTKKVEYERRRGTANVTWCLSCETAYRRDVRRRTCWNVWNSMSLRHSLSLTHRLTQPGPLTAQLQVDRLGATVRCSLKLILHYVDLLWTCSTSRTSHKSYKKSVNKCRTDHKSTKNRQQVVRQVYVAWKPSYNKSTC